jgi:hypothetical protein
MAYTWIKLYTEILNDPKMGRLPDHLWRRAIEIFMLAGKMGESGLLPPIPEIMWELRASEDDIKGVMTALENLGIVHQAQPGAWIVTNFARRQAAMTDAERKAKQRSGSRDVTPMSRSSHDGVTEEEEEVEEEVDIKLIKDAIGKKIDDLKVKTNPNAGTIIGIWLKDFGFTEDVITRALILGAGKSINYADSILCDWHTNGVPDTRKKPNAKPNPASIVPPAAIVYTDDDRAAAAAVLLRKQTGTVATLGVSP